MGFTPPVGLAAKWIYTGQFRGHAPLVSVQHHYNAVWREDERALIPLCKAEGIGLVAYALQLWLGLYGNTAEWPWTYMFLALLMFLFVVESAGRSLGFDAWLRRNVLAVRDGKGLIGWFLHIAG